MINIFKDIWYALTSPEKYREFMNYNKGKLLLYVLVLTLFSGVITVGIPAAQFLAAGGFGQILNDQIPEFSISSQNGFQIEEPVVIDSYNYLVKADSNVVYEDITDISGEYGSYDYMIVLDREQIYVKSANDQGIVGKFEDMGDLTFTKQDILSYVPVMYVTSVFVIILSFLFDFGYYFMTAFVVSWGSGVFVSFMRLKIGGKKLFKMAVYAGTLSYLLNIVQFCIGKTIPNFSLFSLIISTGYMYFAIKDYKDNGMDELPPEYQMNDRED